VLRAIWFFLAGTGGRRQGLPTTPRGRVGAEASAEEAYGHARPAGLALVAAVREAAGSLDNVAGSRRRGLGQRRPEFSEQAK
jgi:hypothetical protein